MVMTPSVMVGLGTKAPDFALPDTRGSQGGEVTVRRDDFEGKPLLMMFICNHCPFVKHLRLHLAETCKTYQDKGVAVVGISSNDVEKHPDDSPEKMAAEVDARGYAFPYLYDASQEVAKRFEAACTPEFFLYDADRKLVYRGQFDDSRPSLDVPVTGSDLRAACDAVLAGELPSPAQRPSVGCNIKWKAGNSPPWFG